MTQFVFWGLTIWDLTVINRGDLEKALEEPEKYKDVFVRIGGFSSRYVDLPRDVQLEILSRKTY